MVEIIINEDLLEGIKEEFKKILSHIKGNVNYPMLDSKTLIMDEELYEFFVQEEGDDYFFLRYDFKNIEDLKVLDSIKILEIEQFPFCKMLEKDFDILLEDIKENNSEYTKEDIVFFFNEIYSNLYTYISIQKNVRK